MEKFDYFKPYEGSQPYIFISYAHANQDDVLPIVQDLHEHGYNIWYDEGIEVGSEWQECIASHLIDAHLVIAFISDAYIASDNCRREMHYALTKRIKVINVFLQQTQLTPGMEMQIGNIFALMKYSFPSEEFFYDKLYSAPLLNSENFSCHDEEPRPEQSNKDKLGIKPKEKHRKEKKKGDVSKGKKKKIIVLSTILLMLGMIIAGTLVAYFSGYLERLTTETKTVTTLSNQTEADFTQPVFEAAAREYTGIASGPITVGDLQGLTAIYICGDQYWLDAPQSGVSARAVGETSAKITDWQGREATVMMGEVTDLSDLRYFSSLKTLWLQFQSLNTLDTMPVCSIENLNISYCRVASLQNISNLPELRSIAADGSSLTDLGDIKACLKLENASFLGGYVADYSDFKPLNKIRSVTLSNSTISDIGQILDHGSLRSVALYNCDLSGRFFNKFDNEDVIMKLCLSECAVDDLAGISEFTNMAELTLYRCTGIPGYLELANMDSLKTVYADKDTAEQLDNLNAGFAVVIIED